MRFSFIPLALLTTGFMLASNASNAQTTQPQTYDAVRQALIDGKHVTAIFDFTTCLGGSNFRHAGVAIQSFMVDDSATDQHIAFSDIHTTVQKQGTSADGWINNEFMRYTMEKRSPRDTVTLNVYTWPPGATSTQLKRTIVCQLGNGAWFHW
ncbi:MAG TPA: VirK family protein [Dyella sp.]|uniref:VirK family protein n=1 Tax=Dyella sp. TaxID=1869338 RepID=UPI002F9259F5